MVLYVKCTGLCKLLLDVVKEKCDVINTVTWSCHVIVCDQNKCDMSKMVEYSHVTHRVW